jgi:spermidine/putrescine transport system substrate-binding protein
LTDDDHGSGVELGGEVAFLRGLTERRTTRREALRAAGLAGGAFAAGSLLAACGIAGTRDTGWHEGFDWAGWWKHQSRAGVLDFANWPLYIDTAHGTHPSLDAFTKATGIKVNYLPVIQDNASFLSQISPTLQAGQSIGYDIVVMTNGWELTQLVKNRWLIPLDHSRLKTFERYAGPGLTGPGYDPQNTYTVTWQSGITAIGYDPKQTGRPITSVRDLFDPAFKGKVGMLTDDTELGSVGMLALGIEPSSSTPADWRRAAKLLTKQRNEGLVRQYYDNSYIKALEDGDVAITQAYSGDVFQANNSGFPHLRFVVPKEGGMLWHDNCMIPLHAAHPVDAIEWMNFYYQPRIEAMIEDWVNYICPVPAARPIIVNKLKDPTVGNSPLIFPPRSLLKRLHGYYNFKGIADHEEWTSIFDPIFQS